MAFEDEVAKALDDLPPELAAGLHNVAVLIEEERPDRPGLLGLYYGVPLPERRSGDPIQPDTITIYREPLERLYPDPEELREQIRVTVLHELAHYFGIGEERLCELGYG